MTRHTKTFEEMALTGAKPTDWLIEGIYPQGDTVLISAPSHSGKTYLVISQAMAVAYGEPWLDRYPTKHGGVLYIPSEGHRTIGRRMMAEAEYRYGHRLDMPKIETFTPRLRLHPTQDTPTMRQLAETMADLRPVFVIVDVLRDTAAGITENADEFGDVFGRLRNMAHAYGATMLVVHHTGKDTSKGARGHSSLKDKADIEAVLKSAPIMHDAYGVPSLTSMTMDTTAPGGKNRNEDPYRLTVYLARPEGAREAVITGLADGPIGTNLPGWRSATGIREALAAANLPPTSSVTVRQLADALGISKPAAQKQAETYAGQGLYDMEKVGGAWALTLTEEGQVVTANQVPTSKLAPGQVPTNPQHPMGAEGLVVGSPLKVIAEKIEAAEHAIEEDPSADWEWLIERLSAIDWDTIEVMADS